MIDSCDAAYVSSSSKRDFFWFRVLCMKTYGFSLLWEKHEGFKVTIHLNKKDTKRIYFLSAEKEHSKNSS